MKLSRHRWLLLATSILAIPVPVISALAQEEGHQRGFVAENSGIPEIIITAQRKSESVLSVPLSIEATSGEQLTNTGIKDLTSLQFTSPGYLPTDSSGRTNLFVRGVGNSIFVGADPSVATFIDDVPRIYATLINAFADVDRVELLKGAQGGLYGRNATGGVLNIITRQPSTERFEGKAEVSYGERNTFRAAGYVNIPLGDNVAFMVAAQREAHDPYVKNIATNTAPYSAANFPSGSYPGLPQQTADFFNSAVRPRKGLNDLSFWAIDNKLALNLSDNFKINIAVDYNDRDDTTGEGMVNLTPFIP